MLDRKVVGEKETVENLTCFALCSPGPSKELLPSLSKTGESLDTQMLCGCEQLSCTSSSQPSLTPSEENLVNSQRFYKYFSKSELNNESRSTSTSSALTLHQRSCNTVRKKTQAQTRTIRDI